MASTPFFVRLTRLMFVWFAYAMPRRPQRSAMAVPGGVSARLGSSATAVR
jgi:hypothetical protein